MLELNRLYNMDCMELLNQMDKDYVHLTLTDIPYNVVNRDSNGLRNLDKKEADVMVFDLVDFLDEIYRVTQGTAIIFCGKEQLSPIHGYFANKQERNQGTVRQLI